MIYLDLTFDVTDEVGSGETLAQTAWLFLPDDPGTAHAAVLALPGGTYDKHYWHLDVPGYPGYSFAEHLADRGYIVVALDHLGVGHSTDPRASGTPGLELLAKGDAAVAGQLRAALRSGELAAPVPCLDIPVVGAGHSMGACLTTMVQSATRPYDAVVLLGYGVQITNVHNDTDADEIEAGVQQGLETLRWMNGFPPDAQWGVVQRAHLRRPLFHAPDVPDAVVAADDAVESRVPLRAAASAITPGYVEKYAEAVDVPVFLGYGDLLDVSPEPRAEVLNYRNSGDVTLYLVEGSAHCHNFAGNRAALWDRIAGWIPTATTSTTGRAGAAA